MLSFALYKFEITESMISVLFEVKKVEIPDLKKGSKNRKFLINSIKLNFTSLIHAFFVEPDFQKVKIVTFEISDCEFYFIFENNRTINSLLEFEIINDLRNNYCLFFLT